MDPSSSILYDVLVFREWTHHNKDSEDENNTNKQQQRRWPWTSTPSPAVTLPLLQSRLPGAHLTVTPDCHSVAALLPMSGALHLLRMGPQSHYLSVGSVVLPADPVPALARIQYSPDGAFLVHAASNGKISVLDATGSELYSLLGEGLAAWEAKGGMDVAIRRMFFDRSRLKRRKKGKRGGPEFMHELILVDYKGEINSFLLSFSGYQELSSFSLSSVYPFGVTDAVFVSTSGLLFISGEASAFERGCKTGLTCWRLTSEAPFYERMQLEGAADADNKASFFGGFIKSYISGKNAQDPIYLLEMSPGEDFIAASHLSGALSVYTVPSLVLVRSVPLEEQACHDDVHPDLLQMASNSIKKKEFLTDPLRWHASCLRWWDAESLVVTRFSGGMSLLPLKDASVNLLGSSAEFFSPRVTLSEKKETGLFILEEETKKVTLKGDGEDGEEEEEDEEEDEGIMATAKALFSSVTGSGVKPVKREREKQEIRLLYLQSTSPEELYHKKIESTEYGEAIILARHYGLDCDMVYERQWRLSNHNKASIQDYLGKVKNTGLVLREVLLTVADIDDDVEDLLKFGLMKVKDWQRDESKDDEDENEYGVCSADLKRFECLLQEYSSKLATYRYILSDRHSDADDADFSASFYRRFRSRTSLNSALEFALKGDVSAVMCMLDDDLWDELKEHYLTILDSFPECLPPSDYADILPPKEHQRHGEDVTPEIRAAFQVWYERRARELEREGGFVGGAFSLLEMGKAAGVNIDKKLFHSLATLYTITVENRGPVMTLDELQSLERAEVLNTLMAGKTEHNFVKEFQRLSMPYLARVEELESGVRSTLCQEYLTQLAANEQLDLARILLQDRPIMTTAFGRDDYVLACVATLQASGLTTELSVLSEYLSFLAKLRSEQLPPDVADGPLGQAISDVLCHATSVRLLRRYDLFVTVGDLHEAREDGDHARKLLEAFLKAAAVHQAKGVTSWDDVLTELFELRASCESCPINDCFQLFCNRLLTSGSEDNIVVVLGMLEPAKASQASQDLVKTLRRSGVSSLTPAVLSDIGLSAANHYFESARDCSDASLALAARCLDVCHIGTKEPAAAAVRMDKLLTAVKLLSHFSSSELDLIPRTLRKISSAANVERFSERLMKSEPFTLRVKERISSVARNLCAAFDIVDEGLDGRLLNGMANFATEMRNYKISLNICQEIMATFDSNGWEACLNLASEPSFATSQTFSSSRKELLTFCVVHASKDRISEVMALQGEVSDKARPGFIFAADVDRTRLGSEGQEEEQEEPEELEEEQTVQSEEEESVEEVEEKEEEEEEEESLHEEESPEEEQQNVEAASDDVEVSPTVTSFLKQMSRGVPASMRTLASIISREGDRD